MKQTEEEKESVLRTETHPPPTPQQPEETGYVAGFMFDLQLSRVALIRKSKPAWQHGKLNGIGGHIEAGETPLQAMVREFTEEAGRETDNTSWHHYAQLKGPEFSVDFFMSVGDLDGLESPNDEQIELLNLGHVDLLYAGMIENLPWLIALALDFYQDGRPSFAQITYPSQREPLPESSLPTQPTEGVPSAEGETTEGKTRTGDNCWIAPDGKHHHIPPCPCVPNIDTQRLDWLESAQFAMSNDSEEAFLSWAGRPIYTKTVREAIDKTMGVPPPQPVEKSGRGLL